MRFEVSLPADHFDLELCATSGQVFRWAKHPAGGWLGVDGDHWYRVQDSPDAGTSSNIVRATGMNRDARRDALAYVAEPRRSYDRVVHRIETNATEDDFRRLFRLDWDAEAVRAEILRRGP